MPPQENFGKFGLNLVVILSENDIIIPYIVKGHSQLLKFNLSSENRWVSAARDQIWSRDSNYTRQVDWVSMKVYM